MNDHGAPPTLKQRRMLAFFGCSAKTAAEAHRVISERLADPVDGKRWLLERARMVTQGAREAIQGQKGHHALFAACATLVHGFALNHEEAKAILMSDYNPRCVPPFADHEIEYKLRSAAGAAHKEPRGHMIGDQFAPRQAPAPTSTAKAAPAPRRPKVEYDPEALRVLAKDWREVVNLPWLADRSAVDPALVTTERFLRTLYPNGEKILTFDVFKSQGQALWPDEKPPTTGPDGVWFLPQPVAGKSYPNPRSLDRRTGGPKMSRRSEESVREFRYLVLESDQADARDWLGFLVRLPFRIEAIYTSAGRSVHALVRVNCATKSQFDAYKAALKPMLNLLALGGVDEAVFSCVRLTRLPDCWRQGSRGEDGTHSPYPAPRLQKLLYLRPSVPGEKVRAICELPSVRDVVGTWCAAAKLGPVEIDPTGAAPGAEIARALHFYAPANRRVREALQFFNQTCADAGFDCDQTKP